MLRLPHAAARLATAFLLTSLASVTPAFAEPAKIDAADTASLDAVQLGALSALQMGAFTVCKPGLPAIRVVLANSGRVRTEKTRDACAP